MAFLPPINLGSFKPSPATLAQWVYDIWQYLQENPIATQEQLQEYIATFITTSPETQELIGEGVEQYLLDNPPQAPVQSVQGKTGAVTLAFNDILKNNNTAPVYRAASMPSQSTLQAQYNLGYRLFVNTTTQEIYSITNTGSTTLVGKGKFDGTTIDVNTAEGDTTIAEELEKFKLKSGEYLTLNGFGVYGWVTNNQTEVNVSVPCSMFLEDGKTIRITNVHGSFRSSVGGYVRQSGDLDWTSYLDANSVTYVNGFGFRFTLTSSTSYQLNGATASFNNTLVVGSILFTVVVE